VGLVDLGLLPWGQRDTKGHFQLIARVVSVALNSHKNKRILLRMARNQKNFAYQLYIDDNGQEWNYHGETGGAATAVDGHATFDATKPVFGRQSRRRHPRKIVYQDSVTHRTVTPVFYTAAAYAAVAPGDIIAVQVAGLATTVNYAAIEKIPERMPLPRTSLNLADS
jgi:hypothetical protein